MREVVERLGGVKAVAEALDVTTRSVTGWIAAGQFPIFWRDDLAALARGRLVLPDHLIKRGLKKGRKRHAETKERAA